MHAVFLNQQIGNNHEIELENTDYNDKMARKQIHLGQANETFQLHSNEMVTFRQILRGQSEKLQQLRRKNRQTVLEREAKAEVIKKLQSTCEELSEKLKKMRNQTDSAQNRLKQLDELVEAEEKSLNCVELEVARMSQMLYRSKTILQQWQSEHKLVEVNAQMKYVFTNEAIANCEFFLDGNSCFGDDRQIDHRQFPDTRKSVQQTNGDATGCGK